MESPEYAYLRPAFNASPVANGADSCQIGNGQRSLWQHGDPRARTNSGRLCCDRSADVVTRGEVGAADDFVRQRTVNQNAGLALDEGLDLCLPLLGTDKSGRRQHGENFLRTRGGAEQFIEWAVRRHAFAAFAGQDEQAARLENARPSAHPFNTLIQVEIERVAAVRCDDDVEGGGDLLHGRFSDKLNSDLVRLEQVPGKDTGDLPCLIQRNVQQETRTYPQRDLTHLLPDRVAGGDAEDGLRMADVRGAVVAHHRLQPGDARHDVFGAAAESGEEMRLDKAGRDTDIRLSKVADYHGPGRELADAPIDDVAPRFRLRAGRTGDLGARPRPGGVCQ